MSFSKRSHPICYSTGHNIFRLHGSKVKNTLEASGKDVVNSTRFECKFMFRLTEVKTNTADWWLKGQAPAPETVDNPYPSSKVVKCVKTTLVSSVFSHLPHSFRVCSHIFPTRFEWNFASSPLVSSVVFSKLLY